MKLLGIFITVKGKEEALHCIDAHIYKYKNKHAGVKFYPLGNNS